MACHHRLWVAHTIKQRQAWNDITAFGQHIRSNDVGRERTSPPLDDTLGRMTSGVACRHRLRAVHTVKRREAWHAIFAFGQHKHSKDVGCGMPSPPLDCTNSRTTSGVAFNHRLLAAQTVERRRAWHAIIALGWQTRSDDVRRGIPSSRLGSTHGRTTSGVACFHRLWAAHTVERHRA